MVKSYGNVLTWNRYKWIKKSNNNKKETWNKKWINIIIYDNIIKLIINKNRLTIYSINNTTLFNNLINKIYIKKYIKYNWFSTIIFYDQNN